MDVPNQPKTQIAQSRGVSIPTLLVIAFLFLMVMGFFGTIILGMIIFNDADENSENCVGDCEEDKTFPFIDDLIGEDDEEANNVTPDSSEPAPDNTANDFDFNDYNFDDFTDEDSNTTDTEDLQDTSTTTLKLFSAKTISFDITNLSLQNGDVVQFAVVSSSGKTLTQSTQKIYSPSDATVDSNGNAYLDYNISSFEYQNSDTPLKAKMFEIVPDSNGNTSKIELASKNL